MAEIGMDVVLGQILGVLAEAFDGPHQTWSYFTDSGRDSGLLGTLERLSAADASRVLGRTSIAAHVHHVIFGLEASAAWIEGDRTTRKWSESWSLTEADDERWRRMQEELRSGYRDLRKDIELFAASSAESMGGVVGALAHVAYHLGAIRQKAAIAMSL
jgi:hypothetical protein